MSTANKFIRSIKKTWREESDGFVVNTEDALQYAKTQYRFDTKTDQNHEIAWSEALRTVQDELNIKEIK